MAAADGRPNSPRREWQAPENSKIRRTDLLRQGRSEVTTAKSYRLLRAILNTAVKADRLIKENPCRMAGFDKEPTRERPTASVDQVWQLSTLIPRRFRALVLFAAFTGLRWGELVALRPRDVDLEAGVVHVVRKSRSSRTASGCRGRPSPTPASAPWPCRHRWSPWYANTWPSFLLTIRRT